MPQPLIQATGRRKSSVARVRLVDGNGAYIINGDRSLDDYFPKAYRMRVQEPLWTRFPFSVPPPSRSTTAET